MSGAGFKSYRTESRTDYGAHEGKIDREALMLGAVFRIADATELMAKDREQMERNLKYYKSRCEGQDVDIRRMARSNAALRGVIRRLKRTP